MFVLFFLTVHSLFGVEFYLKPVDFKKDTSLTFYADEKKTFAADVIFPFAQIKGSFRQNEYNFGVSGFTEKIMPMFPCSVKVGNLSESGSLSKLNSMALSGGNSPFSVDFATASSIYANLPSFSSFTKPVSTFVQAGYKDKTSRKKTAGFSLNEIKANCFFTPQSNDVAASIFAISSFLQNKVKLSGSLTVGNFFYNEKVSSSWFSSDLYFPEGRHTCALFQITTEIPHYKVSFSEGFYETPFGIVSSLFRLDNLFTAGNSSFSFSCYYNPNSRFQKILSSSQSLLQDLLQFKASCTHKIMARRCFIKIGILAYTKFGLSENSAEGKLSLGMQITNSLFSVNFYVYGNSCFTRDYDFVSAELENVGFSFSGKLYFPILSPSFSATSLFSFSDDYKKVNSSTKFGVKLAFLKNPKVYFDSSYSFSTKNGGLSSQNMQFSISSTFVIKKVKIIGSLGWKVDL